jgi:hypothetical protein
MVVSGRRAARCWLLLAPWGLTVLVGILVAFVHLWDLGAVPRTFWLDEEINKLNAESIAQTGNDRHGNFLPLFFEERRDFRSPLFIYSAAVTFTFLEPSTFLTRSVSAVYFLLFLLFLMLLVRVVWPEERVILTYALLAGGFLPWFFALSRTAYIIMPQLMLLAAALFFLHRTYHGKTGTLIAAALTGVSLGFCIYTYPSARLLVPLFLLLICVFYLRRSTLIPTLMILGTSAVIAIPFALQLLLRPETMMATAKLKDDMFVYFAIPLMEKGKLFFQSYAGFFHPRFLFASGSFNLHHHTGYGGELFIIVGCLAVVGVLSILLRKERDRFGFFLIAGMLISPLAGALTIHGTLSIPRTILLGVFLLVLSCYGLASITRIRKPYLRSMVLSVILLVLVGESIAYTHDYFTRYAGLNWDIFDEEGGLGLAMSIALYRKPQSILIDASLDPEWRQWCERDVPTLSGIGVTSGTPKIVPGGCVILASKNRNASLETTLVHWQDVPVPRHEETIVRCYGGGDTSAVAM